MSKKRYQENPSREANTAIGGGIGAVIGAVLLGLPGALIGGAIGGVVGASRGDTRRMLANQRCPVGMQVQSLIFDRRAFSRAEAAAWARRNGYRTDKSDTTENSYRFRQKSPAGFTRESFRTIALSDRVSAVIGCPRT